MVFSLIDSYDFGSIVINGKRYTSDVMVFPEHVIDGWWRRVGHELHIEDLKEVINLEPKPRVLVVGTGYYGCVKISAEVEEFLKIYGIELVAQPTMEACRKFNEILRSGKRVVGAFHLTC
jgi:hypothetical protein